MSTHVPPEAVPVIRDAVSRHPGGATIKDILAAFPEPPARRTLQRWLGNLVQAGELLPKAPDDPADPIRYLLPSVVASVGGQRSPNPVASVPDAGLGQRDPAVASDANERRGQRSETVASDHGQRPADVGHANAGQGLPSAQATATPSLTNHGQRDPAAASVADETRGQRSDAVASDHGQRSADAGRADAGHAPQPKPHRRKPAGAAAGQTVADATDADPTAPAGAVGSTAADVVTDLVDRVLRPRPKSGSPVRKRHRRTVPLVIATTVAAALLGWLGHLTWNVWTLSGAAAVAAIGAGVLAWESRQGSADSDPGSATLLSTAARRQPSAAAAWAAAGLGIVALIAAFLAYRQFRLRPTIGTVETFVTSRLAPLPGRVIALDVTFQAPGKAGVRLTYRAAVENTAPLYQTVGTISYLDNQPGHPLTALTDADLRLEGVAGDKVRSAVGPAPAPDPRRVILLKPAVPIGTTAVASGTLVAWRTNNGWKFTIEQEIPPRFAGEPRPTDKPSYDLDAPAESAAYAALVKNALAYAAKVHAASLAEMAAIASAALSDRRKAVGDKPEAEAPVAAGVSPADQSNAVSRKDAQEAQENRTTDNRGQIAAESDRRKVVGDKPEAEGPVAAGVPPAIPTTEDGGQTAATQPRSISAFVPSPAQGHPGSVTPPPSSGANPADGPSPRDALRQHVSVGGMSLPLGTAFPTAPGAYALGAAGWTPLPRAHTQKVQSTPQALTMKLLTMEYAEDALAGRTPKSATDPIANVILTGADELPTASAGDLVLVYVGELKLPSAAIMTKYPALKDYPAIELAPVQLAGTIVTEQSPHSERVARVFEGCLACWLAM